MSDERIINGAVISAYGLSGQGELRINGVLYEASTIGDQALWGSDDNAILGSDDNAIWGDDNV